MNKLQMDRIKKIVLKGLKKDTNYLNEQISILNERVSCSEIYGIEFKPLSKKRQPTIEQGKEILAYLNKLRREL